MFELKVVLTIFVISLVYSAIRGFAGLVKDDGENALEWLIMSIIATFVITAIFSLPFLAIRWIWY